MRLIMFLAALFSASALGQVTKSTVMVSVPNCNPSPALASYAVDVYRPPGNGPFPLVGVAHGFQNAKENYEQLARLLAARDVVVVVPQFPLLLALQCGYADHARNATILLAAMDQQIAAGGIDPNRLGLAGHSAGGLAAFLAAAQRATQAVVLLDATDQNLGAMQVANVSEPVLFLSAEGSQCNVQNNSAAWYGPLTGLKGRLRVVGGTHCEPQDPVNPTCTGACGGAVLAARQSLFKKYTVAFFDRFLNGVSAPCLEALAAADEQAGVISMVDLQLGACAATDAGVALDAGLDAGGLPDAGAPDAGLLDAGLPDAGLADAGLPDAGLADAGLADAGLADAGLVDGGLADAGASDGGLDRGSDAPRGCGCFHASEMAVLTALLTVLRRRRTPGKLAVSG